MISSDLSDLEHLVHFCLVINLEILKKSFSANLFKPIGICTNKLQVSHLASKFNPFPTMFHSEADFENAPVLS